MGPMLGLKSVYRAVFLLKNNQTLQHNNIRLCPSLYRITFLLSILYRKVQTNDAVCLVYVFLPSSLRNKKIYTSNCNHCVIYFVND